MNDYWIKPKEWLAAVQNNGYALGYLVPKERRTAALCLAGVQNDGTALELVPEALKTEAMCLDVVQNNGTALYYVPNALRTDAVCIAAVRYSRYALDYLPEGTGSHCSVRCLNRRSRFS